jgi:hypothetical protein
MAQYGALSRSLPPSPLATSAFTYATSTGWHSTVPPLMRTEPLVSKMRLALTCQHACAPIASISQRPFPFESTTTTHHATLVEKVLVKRSTIPVPNPNPNPNPYPYPKPNPNPNPNRKALVKRFTTAGCGEKASKSLRGGMGRTWVSISARCSILPWILLC